MDILSVALVGAIILFLFVTVLCIYAVPLRFRVRVDCVDGTAMAVVSASWLCLGLRGTLSWRERVVHLLVGDVALPLPVHLPVFPPAIALQKTLAPQGAEVPAVPPFLEAGVRIVPALVTFARATLRSLSLRRLECRAVVGLSGPAETGMLFGYFMAAKPILSCSRRIKIDIVPDFSRERLEGHLELDATITRPFDLVARIVRLLLLWEKSRVTGAIPA